jgi:hypothetical protein
MERVMRELLVIVALTVGSITSFANSFDAGITKKVVTPCMAKFNMTPYIAEAVGGDQPQPIDLNFVKSLRNFRATGHVILSEAQAADPKTVECATFIEGALAGGGAVQDADQKPSPYALPVQTVDMDQRIQDCQTHFDISQWVKPELVVSLIADKPIITITPSQEHAIESFGKTGELPMTNEQKADPKAMACEVYASGYMVGGVDRLFVGLFSSAVGKMVGDAVSKTASAIVGK